MDANSKEIDKIYLQLKNKNYTELLQNKDVKNIVEEIQKNEYSDAQLIVLAKLLYRLKNIDRFTKEQLRYDFKEGFNPYIIAKYYYSFYSSNNFNKLNNKINTVIQELISKNIMKRGNESSNIKDKKLKKTDIILRFIDEYIEASKENIKILIGKPNKSYTSNIYSTISKIRKNYKNKTEIIKAIKDEIDKLNEDNLERTLENIRDNLLQNKDLNEFLGQLFTFIGKNLNENIKYILANILAYFVNQKINFTIDSDKYLKYQYLIRKYQNNELLINLQKLKKNLNPNVKLAYLLCILIIEKENDEKLKQEIYKQQVINPSKSPFFNNYN
jgi:hypothetical protein